MSLYFWFYIKFLLKFSYLWNSRVLRKIILHLILFESLWRREYRVHFNILVHFHLISAFCYKSFAYFTSFYNWKIDRVTLFVKSNRYAPSVPVQLLNFAILRFRYSCSISFIYLFRKFYNDFILFTNNPINYYYFTYFISILNPHEIYSYFRIRFFILGVEN